MILLHPAESQLVCDGIQLTGNGLRQVGMDFSAGSASIGVEEELQISVFFLMEAQSLL